MADEKDPKADNSGADGGTEEPVEYLAEVEAYLNFLSTTRKCWNCHETDWTVAMDSSQSIAGVAVPALNSETSVALKDGTFYPGALLTCNHCATTWVMSLAYLQQFASSGRLEELKAETARESI